MLYSKEGNKLYAAHTQNDAVQEGGGLWSHEYTIGVQESVVINQQRDKYFFRGVYRVLAALGDKLPTESRYVPADQIAAWNNKVSGACAYLGLPEDIVENAFLIKYPLLYCNTSIEQLSIAVQDLEIAIGDMSNTPEDVVDTLRDWVEGTGMQCLGGRLFPFNSPCITPHQQVMPPNFSMPEGAKIIQHLSDEVKPSRASCVNLFCGYYQLYMGCGTPCVPEHKRHGRGKGLRPKSGTFKRTRKYKRQLRPLHWLQRDFVPVSFPHGYVQLIPVDDDVTKRSQGASELSLQAHSFIAWAMHGHASPFSKLTGAEHGLYPTCCMHICNNSTCLNPLHIWYGHKSENMRASISQEASLSMHSIVVAESLLKSETLFGLPNRFVSKELSILPVAL
jgi:hypothetical protein